MTPVGTHPLQPMTATKVRSSEVFADRPAAVLAASEGHMSVMEHASEILETWTGEGRRQSG